MSRPAQTAGGVGKRAAATAARGEQLPSRWALQDAKARFSELVRRARAEGPQLVTVHGDESVVVVAADEYRRLTGEPTGKRLVELMANSPLRDVDFDRRSVKVKVRDVDL